MRYLIITALACVCAFGQFVFPPASGGTGSGASNTAQLTDLQPSLAAGTVSMATGRIRFGNAACSALTSGTWTAAISAGSGGTGTAKLFITDTCTPVIQYPSSLTLTWTLSGIVAAAVPVPTVPAGAFYVADIAINTAATPRVTGIIDQRYITGSFSLKAGTGMIVDCSTGPCQVSIDTATVAQLGGGTYTGPHDFSAATVTGISGGGSTDLTPTTILLVDEFMPSPNATVVGGLNWTLVGNGTAGGGTSAFMPGIYELYNAAVNGVSAIHLGGYSLSSPEFFNMHSSTWEFQFVVRSDSYYLTQNIWRVGLVDSTSQVPNNGIYVEYNNNSACTATGTDTAWTYVARASSTSTRTASSVVPNTATVYRIRIRSTVAGTVLYSISTNGGAFTAETSIATNVPSTGLVPVIEVGACDTSNHKIYADYFGGKLPATR